MASSHNQWYNTRSSYCRSNSISLFVNIYMNVPSSPDLGRCEHSTLSAHVTKSRLTRSHSTTTRNTRNTCNSSTGTPRLCRMLHTCFHVHGIRLSLVFSHSSVN
eukprot:NODE_475_length_8011_cov_0.074065.p7 type:complete len:104 gc:universal NODE_475_length_8011_cov_0.074065:1914-1603(-)